MARITNPMFIKVRVECVLPVPYEVRDSVDSLAEAGLAVLETLITNNITTVVPGTVTTSWASMPGSYRPPRRAHVVVHERLTPEVGHAVVRDAQGEERVVFVDETPNPHPWDEGLWIFPPDHPGRETERVYRTAYLDSGATDDELKRELTERTGGTDDDD